MPENLADLSHSEPDPALLHKLEGLKRAFLIAAALIAAVTLAGWLIPALGATYPAAWRLMKVESAVSVLVCALSLHLSEPKHTRQMHLLSQVLAVVASLLGVAVLCEYGFHVSFGFDNLLALDNWPGLQFPGRIAPQTAFAIASLGIAILPIQAKTRFSIRVADSLIFWVCLVILVILSGQIFGAMQIFGISRTTQTSPQTLLCLLLLTSVAILRRAENGLFSIFLGQGIGSRIARGLAPILLVLSFFREITRAHLLLALKIPSPYVTALLASVATVVSFGILLFLTWRIRSMETEIRDLSLRDELTGLRNLRGFHLLGEQTLRMAQRSQQQVSVLYIDLDHLKEINDTHGHTVGSAFLVEMSELLKVTFRETDVMGRIGGDEFAVVCQCGHVAISIAAQRLEEASAIRNAEDDRQFPFSLSIGYVTSEEHAHQSLTDLLANADKAMYEEKRRKKLNRT
jgi:diguanylate cyclase (GGDEF)-like protein